MHGNLSPYCKYKFHAPPTAPKLQLIKRNKTGEAKSHPLQTDQYEICPSNEINYINLNYSLLKKFSD